MGIEGIEHLKPQGRLSKIDPKNFIQSRQKQGKTRGAIYADLLEAGLGGSDARGMLNLFYEES